MKYTEAKKQEDRDFMAVKTFCEFLDENGYELMDGENQIEIRKILYSYFGINEGKLEQELRHMLKQLES